MKIGINLVGISYNDGTDNRYRNYKDALDGFNKYIIEPLKKQGNDIYFYLFTYDNIEKENIIKAYSPIIKSTFLPPNYNKFKGGEKFDNQFKIMSITYINSLQQLLEEDLDIVISTRYDINFFKNPFEEYSYDLTKCNFLWREPEFMNLPIVNDTFIVFPHHMTQNLINAIIDMENEPPFGVNIGLHNIYLPMIKQVGEENVGWVDDRFVGVENDSRTEHVNKLYKLTRYE
jgi:hypothetical protein